MFESRMRALAASVARGGTLYAGRCRACHAPAAIAPAAVAFPGLARGEPVERFVERHAAGDPPLAWDSAETADLLAYLASRLIGRPLALDASYFAEEGSR